MLAFSTADYTGERPSTSDELRKAGGWIKLPEGLSELSRMLLHLFEDDAYHLNQASLGRVLVHWIRASNMDVVQRAHYLQEAALVDLRRRGRYYSEKSSHHLKLDLLIALGGALADLVDNRIYQLSRKRTVALRSLLVSVETVIRMVSVHEPVSHQLLYMIKNVLGKPRYLGIKCQFHDAKVLVGAQHLVVRVSFYLLDGVTTQVSKLLALSGNRLPDLVKAARQELLIEYVISSKLTGWLGLTGSGAAIIGDVVTDLVV